MSRVMRKPAYSICENKAVWYRPADQCLCFHYIDSSIPLLPKYEIFKPIAIFFGCTAWFVSDPVGNPKDRFSHDGLKK